MYKGPEAKDQKIRKLEAMQQKSLEKCRSPELNSKKMLPDLKETLTSKRYSILKDA